MGPAVTLFAAMLAGVIYAATTRRCVSGRHRHRHWRWSHEHRW